MKTINHIIAAVVVSLATAIPALAIPVSTNPSLPVNVNDLASFSVDITGVAQADYNTNGSTQSGNARLTHFSTTQLLPMMGLAYSNNPAAFKGCSLRLRLAQKDSSDYQQWSVQVLKNGNVIFDSYNASPYIPTNASYAYAGFYVASDTGPLVGSLNSNVGGSMTQFRSAWFGFYYEYYISARGWQEPFYLWGDGTIEQKVVSNGNNNSYQFTLQSMSGEFDTETNNQSRVKYVVAGGQIMGKGSN